MFITIEQLNIFPIKSLGGISLSESTLTPTGLKGDREWMLVDEKGTFATQRKHPLMATLQPSTVNNRLSLTNSEGDSIQLDTPTEKNWVDVSIWDDGFKALEANHNYSQWITDSLKSTSPLRLVYFDKQIQRTIDHERFGKGHTYFSDGAPFLITNTASLNAFNNTLNQQQLPTVSMNRFRANIVISGLPAFAEQQPQELCGESNNSIIEIKDHCPRCAIITIDQSTGLRSYKAHPFKQLAKINPMPNNPKAPAFGMNSILVRGENNIIRVNERFNLKLT